MCRVCGWEDERSEPWEYSGPNAQMHVEAQQTYLSQCRRTRFGQRNGRSPKRREARDPDWRPYELTDDLMARVRRANEEERRSWEEEQRRTAQDIADDPEGPFQEYNAGMQTLRARAPAMSHGEVKRTIRDLGRAQGLTLPDAYLELLSRLTKDEDFYRHHPVHSVWWMLRYARPGTLRRRWRELRTGTVHLAG